MQRSVKQSRQPVKRLEQFYAVSDSDDLGACYHGHETKQHALAALAVERRTYPHACLIRVSLRRLATTSHEQKTALKQARYLKQQLDKAREVGRKLGLIPRNSRQKGRTP